MEKQCKQCNNTFPKKDKGKSNIYCDICRIQRKKYSLKIAMKKYYDKKKVVQQ